MFEASHVLPKHPGKCSKLHGHSWKLTVSVMGKVDSRSGFVMDFFELKKIVQEEIIDLVDHAHLGCGDVRMGSPNRVGTIQHAVFDSDFYPSSENLVIKFAQILVPRFLPLLVNLESIVLNETCTSSAEWSRGLSRSNDDA
jgi:6-pyruvoyltetrahydropterin/6-carboxytetrahydropterin synthase